MPVDNMAGGGAMAASRSKTNTNGRYHSVTKGGSFAISSGRARYNTPKFSNFTYRGNGG